MSARAQCSRDLVAMFLTHREAVQPFAAVRQIEQSPAFAKRGDPVTLPRLPVLSRLDPFKQLDGQAFAFAQFLAQPTRDRAPPAGSCFPDVSLMPPTEALNCLSNVAWLPRGVLAQRIDANQGSAPDLFAAPAHSTAPRMEAIVSIIPATSDDISAASPQFDGWRAPQLMLASQLPAEDESTADLGSRATCASATSRKRRSRSSTMPVPEQPTRPGPIPSLPDARALCSGDTWKQPSDSSTNMKLPKGARGRSWGCDGRIRRRAQSGATTAAFEQSR